MSPSYADANARVRVRVRISIAGRVNPSIAGMLHLRLSCTSLLPWCLEMASRGVVGCILSVKDIYARAALQLEVVKSCHSSN